MTLYDSLQFDSGDINSMSLAELKRVVRPMASAANSRISRFKASDVSDYSPAFRYIDENHPQKFSQTGKNLNELRNEWKILNNFFQSKTSTVTTARIYKNKINDILGDENLTKDEISDIFKQFHRIEDSNAYRSMIDSIGSDLVLSEMTKISKKGYDLYTDSLDYIIKKYEERNAFEDEYDEIFANADRFGGNI